MKKIILLFLFTISTVIIKAGDTIVIEDHFADRSKLIDNSLLVVWGDNVAPKSCFEITTKSDSNGLSYNALSITSGASPYSTHLPTVGGKPSLKTTTCFDYELSKPIDRNNCTIKVEFDVLWSKYDYPSGNFGENGRIVVALVDNYPNGGAQIADMTNLTKIDAFGSPKYNMRIRNAKPVGTNDSQYNYYSPSFMLYGGGLSEDGEFEAYKSVVPNYWLPGFSSAPGGTAPGQPATGDYPTLETKKSDKPWSWIASTSTWRHITWVIEPEIMSLYHRNSNENETSDQMVSKMSIPKDSFGLSYITSKLNAVHGTSVSTEPTMYKWFPRIEALRFYNRGFNGNIAYFANVKISKSTPHEVGISKHSILDEISVFPNPTYGIINIKGLDEKQVVNYSLSNIAGSLIMEGKTENTIDISNLKTGIFLLKLENNSQQKIIKLLLLK